MEKHTIVTSRPHHHHHNHHNHHNCHEDHNHHNHHRVSLLALAGGLVVDGCARVPAAVESDASARICATRGWQSLWPLPSLSTTAHRARRWQGPGERYELNYTAKSRKQFSQGGSRPPSLFEPRGPQVAILRHALEHMADVCPFVQILDAPVPQKVEQLADFFKGLDSLVLVQVIEVPMISQDVIPQRSVDLVPQMVEQLVEVPTVLTFSSLQQQTAEQIVDIPVPVRERRIARLQGYLPEQSSTAPQFSKKRISARIVTPLSLEEVFKVFRSEFIFVFSRSSSYC